LDKDIEEIPEEEAPIEPLEVKIINKEKKETTPYTPTDNENYADINITSDEIDEFIES